MKKILVLSILAAIGFAGCKKQENTVSVAHTYSTPLIKFSGPIYYSIPVGGTIPTISATSYDTFYNASYPVVLDQSKVDVNTPGLYSVLASASNLYGMVGYSSAYVAVTNVSDSLNLTGYYERLGVPARTAHITKLARGLFMTSNVGGVDTTNTAATGAIVSAVFAVLNDSTIDFGSQLTSVGQLTASSEALSLAPLDTTISYALSLNGFGTQVRTFVKQ